MRKRDETKQIDQTSQVPFFTVKQKIRIIIAANIAHRHEHATYHAAGVLNRQEIAYPPNLNFFPCAPNCKFLASHIVAYDKKLSCSDGHSIDSCFIEFSELLQLERCSLSCIALPAAALQKRCQQMRFHSPRTRSFQMRALPDRFQLQSRAAATLRTGTLNNVAHHYAAATAIPQALCV